MRATPAGVSAGTDWPTVPRAVLVWSAALAVYVVAIFDRSSLAVAGLVAADRFDISAAQLSTFTMLQLVVYAGLQVPFGLALDRFGPRRMLLAGAATLTLAQLGFAFATSYPLGIAARVVLGAGDAMVFLSVLRLVTTWFEPRRVPVVTQLTGQIGQLGSVLAAVPMTIALRELGWTTTYLLAAGVGVVLGGWLWWIVRDTPQRTYAPGPPISVATAREGVRAAWRTTGTRLGLWTHFTCQFSSTVLALLWGYPFFVRGQHVSDTTAGVLLTLLTGSAIVLGPMIGVAVGRRPFHRSSLVLGIVATIVVVWTAVLAWPGDAPLPLLVLLVVVVGVGGPGSMVGFDFARTTNPGSRLGIATGLVNQGGFVASLLVVLAIGVVLDAATPGGGSSYSADAFGWAMCVQYPFWALGASQVWRLRRRIRRDL